MKSDKIIDAELEQAKELAMNIARRADELREQNKKNPITVA